MIWDTGPLVAIANLSDPDHSKCIELLEQPTPFIIPAPVLAEVGYLLGIGGGPTAEAKFLRSIRADKYLIEAPSKPEITRAAHLIEQFSDLNLGTTDAIVMAMAESHNEPNIATLDQRHFTVVKPKSFERFIIHPS